MTGHCVCGSSLHSGRACLLSSFSSSHPFFFFRGSPHGGPLFSFLARVCKEDEDGGGLAELSLGLMCEAGHGQGEKRDVLSLSLPGREPAQTTQEEDCRRNDSTLFSPASLLSSPPFYVFLCRDCARTFFEPCPCSAESKQTGTEMEGGSAEREERREKEKRKSTL